jgi:hypothetical protein
MNCPAWGSKGNAALCPLLPGDFTKTVAWGPALSYRPNRPRASRLSSMPSPGPVGTRK